MAQTSESAVIAIEDGVFHSSDECVGPGSFFEGTDVPMQKLFDSLKKGHSLPLFMDHFPSVSLDQALNALQKQVEKKTSGVMHIDAKVAGDTPVFVGTRVPVKNLFICLIKGDNLKDFHYDFPTVLREQAYAALEMARDILERKAYKSPNRVFHSDRKIMGGTPVFMGTRLPIKNLFDCLAAAYSLKDFYYEFPSASQEQLVAILKMAQKVLEKEGHALFKPFGGVTLEIPPREPMGKRTIKK